MRPPACRSSCWRSGPSRRCAGRRAAGRARSPDEELLPCRPHRCYKRRLQRCAGSPHGAAHRSPAAGARTDRGGPRQLADRGPARRVGAHRAGACPRCSSGGVANRTQAAVAAVQRGWLAALTVLVVLLILAPAAHATSTPSGLRAALTREMRSAGAVRRLGGRRIRTCRLQMEGRCQTGSSIGAKAGHHRGRPGPPRTGGTVRDRNRGERGRSARECLTETSTCAARATPASAPPPCADWPGRSARPVSKTWAAAFTATKASIAAAARSGFGVSPYVGPLSALAFNHGSMLPLARGWQSDPAKFVAGRMRVTLRSGRSTWLSASAPQCACRRDHPGHDGHRRSRHWSGTPTTCRTTTTLRRC